MRAGREAGTTRPRRPRRWAVATTGAAIPLGRPVRPHSENAVYQELASGRPISNRVRSHAKEAAVCYAPGMRHFRPPLFPLAVLVIASLCSGIIHAQSLRGPTQDNGKVLVYPTCVRCPEPSLTRSERLHHVEGVVILQATVSERGRAEQIDVVKGLESGLADRALATVRRWRFRPATGKDEKPTSARIFILITFGLRKKGGGIATG